jgi:multiple sugar transport system permease protein
MTRTEKQNLKWGLIFISPWLVGFLVFCAYPFICSIYYSLCDYSVLSPAVYVGAENYRELFADEVFWKSLYNTLFFAAFAIPLSALLSLALALLLNCNVPAKGIFRVIFFLPSLVPMVSLAILWQWLLNGDLGLVNSALRPLLHVINHFSGTALTPPNWLLDAQVAKWGIIMTVLWGVGQSVVIYLAGLQDVPVHLYESADIDGINFWQKLIHITLPMISPVIYFNTIMALISCLQVFAVPYVMTSGGDGPERSLLFVATYLFQNAFDYWHMGYACAIGVILFLIILVLTIVATKLTEKHVYYSGK